MTHPNDANRVLMGGVPSAKFDVKGQVVKGEVVSVELQQQKDFKTKALLTWPDGNPMMQIVVTLQTNERDPDIVADDGMRKLYVKKQMQQAVRTAVVQANATGLEVGGTLAVQWADETPPEQPGMSPMKIYVAQYAPPAPATADLFGAPLTSPAPSPNAVEPAAETAQAIPTTGSNLI
jgi:hypothetical protein